MRSRGLTKKHQKALELLKTTNLPICEVAKQTGISKYHLYDLVKGKAKAGLVATEFHDNYQSHMDYVDRRAAFESKLFIRMALFRLTRWVESITRPTSMKIAERKHMIDLLKMLNYMHIPVNRPTSYAKAMTQKELDREFARLKVMAGSKNMLTKGVI